MEPFFQTLSLLFFASLAALILISVAYGWWMARPKYNKYGMDKRFWFNTEPDSTGWYKCYSMLSDVSWRWWDGKCWSVAVSPNACEELAGYLASIESGLEYQYIWWTYDRGQWTTHGIKK